MVFFSHARKNEGIHGVSYVKSKSDKTRMFGRRAIDCDTKNMRLFIGDCFKTTV